MAHTKTEFYRDERAKGKTYTQIAQECGVSPQAVSRACADLGDGRFRAWTAQRCIYPNLRSWLNDNRVSLTAFIGRMGLAASGVTTSRFSDYFRGRCFPGKKTIDKMLKVTGLTYEQLWEVEK